MHACLLHFERISLAGAPGLAHQGWPRLLVHWFSGADATSTQAWTLADAASDTADAIGPLTCSLACTDTQSVSAAFLIVRPGAGTANEQGRCLGAIARMTAAALAEAYVEALELAIEAVGRPAKGAFVGETGAAQGAVIDALDSACTRVVRPWFQRHAHDGAGPALVLHDAVMFPPLPACRKRQAVGPVLSDAERTRQALERHYPDASATLRLVLERRTDAGERFPPPPHTATGLA
jgi:hypothetical protein